MQTKLEHDSWVKDHLDVPYVDTALDADSPDLTDILNVIAPGAGILACLFVCFFMDTSTHKHTHTCVCHMRAILLGFMFTFGGLLSHHFYTDPNHAGLKASEFECKKMTDGITNLVLKWKTDRNLDGYALESPFLIRVYGSATEV